MLDLFNTYKNSGKIGEALLIGRNMVNRNPDNEEMFTAYFSYLCTLSETLPSPEDCRDFAQQANIALAFFSENSDLSENLITTIAAFQNRLNAIFASLAKTENERMVAEQKQIEQSNSALLKQLYGKKDILQRAKNQSEMDKILAEISDIDTKLKPDALTSEQASIYDSLTKESTNVISEKMREFEHASLVSYNKQAANAFAKAFDEFKKNESKYKNHTQLFSLASTTLFAFDVSKLFNETMIYYNHVYSYIFSKLDDDGKLALTRYSIECERNLR